jgi:hypothetical protein
MQDIESQQSSICNSDGLTDESRMSLLISSFFLNSSLDDETRPSNAETTINLSAREEDDEDNSFQVDTNSGSVSAASSSSFSSSSSGRVLDDMASLAGHFEDETEGVVTENDPDTTQPNVNDNDEATNENIDISFNYLEGSDDVKELLHILEQAGANPISVQVSDR